MMSMVLMMGRTMLMAQMSMKLVMILLVYPLQKPR